MSTLWATWGTTIAYITQRVDRIYLVSRGCYGEMVHRVHMVHKQHLRGSPKASSSPRSTAWCGASRKFYAVAQCCGSLARIFLRQDFSSEDFFRLESVRRRSFAYDERFFLIDLPWGPPPLRELDQTPTGNRGEECRLYLLDRITTILLR